MSGAHTCHRFDTIKVRLQTSSTTHFTGPLDCLRQTLQREGLRGLYKGASPPLVGWMFMDSLSVSFLSLPFPFPPPLLLPADRPS